MVTATGSWPRAWSLLTGDDVLARLGQTEEGHRIRDAGGGDAGQRFETLESEALEVRDLLVARIGGGREEHGAGDEVGGFPAVAAVVQLVESAHEEGGTREQDHGERELADDEELAEASMAPISGRAARAALQRGVRIEPEGEERGGDAEGEGREERGHERPAEHAPVEGEDGADHPAPATRSDSATRESTARPGSHRRRRRRPAAGTRRTAAAAAGCARRRGRQRTASSRARAIVRASRRFARLEQAMSSTKAERPISMPTMPLAFGGYHGVVDREGAPGGAGVDGREFGREAATEARDEGFGLRAGDGAGATPDEAEPGGAAVRRLLVAETERPEEVERAQVAPVVQGGGQHADDLVRLRRRRERCGR